MNAVSNFFRFIRKIEVISSNKWKTVPNFVTALSFPLAPLLAYFVSVGNMSLAVLTLVLMAACDMLDGALARALNQFSELGKKLDWVRDWWYVIWISVLPIFFLPRPAQLIYVMIFLFETDTLYLTKNERTGNTAGGFKHLLVKIKALLILALGLLVVLRSDLAGWILGSSLAIVYTTRLLLRYMK